MTFDEYKELLLSYLKEEKKLTEKDIQDHLNLSDEEKVEQGYLIKGCLVTDSKDGCSELKTKDNNTRLRGGDRVELIEVYSGKSTKATVIENTFDTISVNAPLLLKSQYDIVVKEGFYLDPLISVLDYLEEGASGTSYIRQLCDIEQPRSEGYRPIDTSKVDIPKDLDSTQREAVENVLKCPSLYCIQGPPGTGKTNVLATIASIFSKCGKEVLIISNTHQAVNNALNKIADNMPIVKIGETLKAQSVSGNIQKYKSFSDYNKVHKKSRNTKHGAIVGMTLHAAIINLGLKKSGFAPTLVLVDEASQIPLTMAAGIASFGAGSIIFIGDDRQMPPIFHPDLTNNDLSVSIFSHLSNLYPDFKTVLDTTYRMNNTICKFVSEAFYEPFGISLKSHASIADRHINGENIQDAVTYINVTTDGCKDFNQEEAKKAVEQAAKYKSMGYDVAIVTPYRKQVNMVYDQWKAQGGKTEDILVDTVERLQGQDVDVIILTTSVSDSEYYKENILFLLDRQRMNVMISRAKQKVIIIKSPIVDFSLNRIQANSNTNDSAQKDIDQMFYIDGEPDTVTAARKLILESFGDLEFYEDGHKYLLHGKQLNSVSGIGHRFIAKPFDEAVQAVEYAKKHGETADYWIKKWRCNSFKATTLGTKTHEYGESLGYLLAGHPELIRESIRVQYNESYNYLAPIHPKEEAVELFMKELPSSYHLVLNETKVYSGKNPDSSKNLKEQICGTFDMLYWFDGCGDENKAGFVILDYKTNANLYSEYNRKYRKMLLSPFDNLVEEDYGLYIIQLNLYALMLEDIGLPVIARKIVWLKEDGTYEIINTPSISDILRCCL